jgi:thiamine transport system substrate-binding protein
MTRLRALVICSVLALAATSCTLVGDGDDGDDTGAAHVVLVTHESFVLPKKLITQFETDSGYDLVIRAAGDAGALTNKLVLTRDAPTGDVAFGVDNTFGSRAIDESVFVPYDAELPPGAQPDVLPGDDNRLLTPIDSGSVCVNVDDTWFAAHRVKPPRTLEDLTRPAYRDLFVLPGATTSSPGLAFLLATIAEYGDGWPDYWQRLMDNGAELTSGWSDAYEVDFTQGGGNGRRPIVLSYDSSPAFTVDGHGGTTTSALLDTCFRQVEYAGVLNGAANPPGARAFVDFLLSKPVQEALPESMYVFPIDVTVGLPPDWSKFAKQPGDPYTVDPAEIAAHRDEWLREWSDVTSR